MQLIMYMWQVSACMGIFFGFYLLLLRRLTFFTLNRWYLLATLLLSFTIPLLTVTVHIQTAPAVIKKAFIVNQALPSSGGFQITAPVKQPSQSVDWIEVIEIAYLIVAIILFIKLIITVAGFFYRLKNASVTTVARVKVVKGTNGIGNGSFFNYIILDNEGLTAQQLEQVMEHEMLHVKYLHSVDRIIVRLAQVILWFNPFVYRYAQTIEENHEFEVDHEIGRRADKASYADMLLHLSVNNQDILFNSFSKVPLKRRIAMLFTKPTSHMKKVIYLLILPVVMISCLAFARFKNEVQTEQYSVIAGIGLLNDDFKVVIDGKSYDKDIVYKISESCIKTVRIVPVTPRIKVVDRKWADAVVNIKTKNGEVIYMTAQEKENLIKERSVSIDKFYVRLHLKDNTGKSFDKAIVQRLNGSAVVTIQPQDKVAFLIDNVFYNENDIRFINPDKIHSLTDTVSVESIKPGEYAKGIAAVFRLHTYQIPAAPDTTYHKPKVKVKGAKAAIIKQTISPNANRTDYAAEDNNRSMTASERQLVQRTLTNPTAPFLSRFHFQRDGGMGFDVVAFTLAGSGGLAILDSNGKIGAFIDGKFYNEDAIKKIPAEKTANLVFDNGANRSKFDKMPEGENYAVPFYFKTKTKQSITDTNQQK